MFSIFETQALVRVEKVSLRGPGALVLTGPSSCGKGQVAAALCSLMSIDGSRHLSMGEILRSTFRRARHDAAYRTMLAERYQLSEQTSIFDCVDSNPELTQKVERHAAELQEYYGRPLGEGLSQLDWLEFCTMRGLLVPNRWTQDLIAARIEETVQQGDGPFILDGYPRHVEAARHLLGFLDALNLPVLKVLHLSISKAEMSHRAGRRGRVDDDEAALRSRFEFYVENVQPSVDYMKKALGSERVALIDAHQPAWDRVGDERHFNLEQSIANVVASSLRSLGVPRVIVRDLLEQLREAQASATSA